MDNSSNALLLRERSNPGIKNFRLNYNPEANRNNIYARKLKNKHIDSK